jgi:ABC-2 type transport system permease protein
MRNQLVAVMTKEFCQVLRDRRMFGMLLVTPLLELVFLGYAVNYDVENIRTVVCDESATAQSRLLTLEMFAGSTFVERPVTAPCRNPERFVRDGEADVSIIIPYDYGAGVRRREPVAIQVLADGSNPTVGRYAQGALEGFTARVSADLFRESMRDAKPASMSGGLAVEPLVLFNPAMRSSLFLVPGVAAMILVISTLIAPAMGIAKEKETGVLDQILVTPLSLATLLAGKIIPFVLFGAFNVMLILVASIHMFDIPFRGSPAIYALGTFLYLFSTLGLSMVVASVSRTQQQAFLTSMLILMPLLMLSGVMTPVANMPIWLRPIAWLSPMKYYVDLVRGVLLKGAGFFDLLLPLSMLAVLGVVIFSSALLLFRRSVS